MPTRTLRQPVHTLQIFEIIRWMMAHYMTDDRLPSDFQQGRREGIIVHRLDYDMKRVQGRLRDPATGRRYALTLELLPEPGEVAQAAWGPVAPTLPDAAVSRGPGQPQAR